MRVLILSNVFPPGFIGGYELGALDVARGLARRGHEVEVLTSPFFLDDTGSDAGGEGEPRVRRILDSTTPNLSLADRAHRASLGGYVLPRNLREVTGRRIAFRPDAVLCFNLIGMGAPTLLQLFSASGMRPVVYMMDDLFHEMPIFGRDGFERVFGREAWAAETRFLFMSRNLQTEVEATLGFAPRHANILPGWYGPPGAAMPPPALPKADVPRRFFFASAIFPHKGISIALEAAAALVAQGADPFVLDVFGGGEVAQLQQRIVALRLQEVVRYQGVPDKVALLASMASYEAMVFPTWHREPFAFVVAEAAAAGCLPLITHGIGAAEWFLDGVDCLKIDRDAASLAAAMRQVIDMAPATRLRMRRRAQSVARRFFGFDDVLDRLEQGLRDVAGPPMADPRAVEAALALLTETWRSTTHV